MIDEKENTFYFVVKENDNGKRLDLFIEKELSKQNTKMSRSSIQKNITNTLVNNKTKKKNYKVKKNDIIKLTCYKINTPPLAKLQTDLIKYHKQNTKPKTKKEINYNNNERGIIYEDQHIIVVNKKKGIVVHPAQGHYKNTLVSLLIDKLTLFDLENNQRPGIVHRLDKDTAGLMLIAKNPITEQKLKEEFYNRNINKSYKAIVKGYLIGEGSFQSPIKRHPVKRKIFTTNPNGKKALTLYKNIQTYKLKKNKYYSLLNIKTITGRTHQIRVHLSKKGYPIIGDVIYSRIKENFEKEGLALFANAISFKHPISNNYMNFEINMPSHFKTIITYLENNSIPI